MIEYANPKLNRYDSLIEYYCKYKFKNCNSDLIKKQMIAESYDPSENDIITTAESSVGAKGLMQFMKETWEQYDYKDNIPVLDHPFNAEENIKAGCKYMNFLYSRFREIPNKKERYKFALASYNAGRGNINKMLSYARDSENLSFNYSDWKRKGEERGLWQKWEYAKRFLGIITGQNAEETIRYVKAITKNDGFYF